MEAAARAPSFPLKHAGFLTAYLLVTSVFIAQHTVGSTPWLTALVGFGLVPLLDLVLGRDRDNLDDAGEAHLAGRSIYDLLLWLWVPVELALVAYAAWRFTVVGQSLGAGAAIGMMVSTGITTGAFGITIAHELGHRSRFLDKLCARVLLALTCYMHFTVEHNRGHHVWVATPRDPATARLGEGFWRFFLRTVPQQYLSAWHLENERLKKQGDAPFSTKNRMIWFSLAPFALGALASLWLGWRGVAFFYGQAVIAVMLLEVVNYIEHYGLVRRELEPGVYERVTPHHSWNASWPISNFLLFGLQRHADHHAHAGRRYQVLRHIDEGPQLPAGYPSMIPLALVPPLWKRVMDKRVLAARARLSTTTPR